MAEEITLNRSLLVQKSDPLRQMKDIPFTLTDLKILDTYLSCINIKGDVSRTLKFSKAEYQELMGLDNVDWRSVTKSVSDLMSLTVKLHVEEDGHNIYREFSLFESAEYDQDKTDDNNSVVLLTCSEAAKDFFYCLNKYHYTKYELDNIIPLTSKSTYLLYVYINAEYQNRQNHHEWDIKVDKLRDDIFDLSNQKSYKEFKVLNRKVLNPSVQEINEKTNYMLEYELVKKGKAITDIHFSCFLKDGDDSGSKVYDPSVYKNKRLRTLARICEYKFSNSQMQEIKSILDDTDIPDFFFGTEEERQEDYLKDMYRQFLRLEYKFANSKKAIKNRFLYFKKTLVSEMDDYEAANIQEDDKDGS